MLLLSTSVKSRDTVKVHQVRCPVKSVFFYNVVASYYLTDSHQALFFQEDIELDGIVISIYWILCKYSLNINEWFWMLEPFI